MKRLWKLKYGEELKLDFSIDKTRKAVRAANKVGIIMALTILLDAYEAEKENAIQFLDLYRELLKQYNNGDVQIKQLQKHIEVRTGVNINDYVEFNMDMVGIENKGDADEAETVCNA